MQPLPVTWAYWPAGAPFEALLPDARCVPQHGNDLGARMGSAIADALADGDGAVIVLGADVPHVDLAVVAEAAERLANDVDLVLGPARDGGYYLFGVHAVIPGLLEDIPWGTATVLAATTARARDLGLRTHLLTPGFDVDAPGDLVVLTELLERGAVRLPRTSALLGRP
jgi:hypothetical protein